MPKSLSRAKAAKILHDKEVRGKPLSPKQRRLMGFVASGGQPTRVHVKGGTHERRAKARERARGG